MEKEIIKKSINNLINDIDKYKNNFNEYDLQARLYYHLMKEFGKTNADDVCRIRLEHNPFDEKMTKEEQKTNWEDLFRKCCHDVNEPDKNTIIEKFGGKLGEYDLVIFNKENKEILHAVEIKIIDNSAPTVKHRGYEDLYVLTKLLQENFPGSKSYIVIFAKVHSENGKMKMQSFLENVQKTYKNAEAYTNSEIFFKSKMLDSKS
jgi:hypothetical protein